MSEELNNQPEETTPSVSGLLKNIKDLIASIFSVHEEVDKSGTVATIKKDIVFRGFNIWILIVSILICSLGLNLNSVPVIIGAMLISPLMGPITGIGFAIGTFDRDLLILALKNLAIAMVISILASFIFFLLAPTGFDHSELDSRTKPGVLDLLVALFGGFAGILAGTRGSKTNVIPGVAIATALMPPLCTAGYGLAVGDMNYFLGASYLFFINSVFISLAALIVVRYLRFPIATYVNPKLQKRGRNFIIVFVLLVAVPSIFIYRNALRESIFKSEARKFVAECVHDDEHSVMNPEYIFTDSVRIIKLYVFGKEYSQREKDSLNRLMPGYGLNEDVRLQIHNMGTFDAYKSLSAQKDEVIVEAEDIKNRLSMELARMVDENKDLAGRVLTVHKKGIEFAEYCEEALVLFEDLDTIDYAIKPMDDSLNHIAVLVLVDWRDKISASEKKKSTGKLKAWLSLKANKSDSIRIVEMR